MFKPITKLAAAALALSLALPAAPAAAAGRGEEITVRVGLASAYYHNSLGELEAAHLENEDGYGEGSSAPRSHIFLSPSEQSFTASAALTSAGLPFTWTARTG